MKAYDALAAFEPVTEHNGTDEIRLREHQADDMPDGIGIRQAALIRPGFFADRPTPDDWPSFD
jgi:hypothetical protein